jgi:hypothetical protein
MKSYVKAILIGLILWASISVFFFPKIVDFTIKENSTLYIFLYDLFIYFIIGFIIGWYGKSKGLLLGILFGTITVIIVFVITFSTAMFKTTANDIGTLSTLGGMILSLSVKTIIVCSGLGGFLGSRIRGKNRGSPL